MPQNRLFTFVGFAIKSRKVIYGVDNLVAAKRKPEVILYSESLGENSRKSLVAYADKNMIERYEINLDEILSGKNCKALGITDRHLADAVKSEIKESRI